MERTRIGLIGAGKNARGHARYYHTSDRTDLVAIADPNADAGRALSDELGAKHVDDFTLLLDDVEAVVISSPNFLHHDQAIASAEAGKHVYCEKPMGLDYAQAAAIHDAVDKAGVASAVGFSPRLGPDIQTMQKLMREGRVGDLISIWSRRLTCLSDDAFSAWRSDSAKSGGLLYEINIHELDWMMMLAGPVESVFAATRATMTHGERANDHLWITLQFENQAVGQHEGSWRAATPNFYRGLHGSAGGASTDEWGNHLQFASLGGQRADVELEPAFDLRADWLNAIAGQGPSQCHTGWALQVMRVAEAVIQSAAAGQAVRPSDINP